MFNKIASLILAIMLIAVLIPSPANAGSSNTIIRICDGEAIEAPINIAPEGWLEQQFQITDSELGVDRINVVDYTQTFGLLIGTSDGLFQWNGEYVYSCPNWQANDVNTLNVYEFSDPYGNSSLIYHVVHAISASKDVDEFKRYDLEGDIILEGFGDVIAARHFVGNDGQWYWGTGEEYDRILNYVTPVGFQASTYSIDLVNDLGYQQDEYVETLSVETLVFNDSVEAWMLVKQPQNLLRDSVYRMYVWSMDMNQLVWEVPLQMQDGFIFREVRDFAANYIVAAIATDIGPFVMNSWYNEYGWYNIAHNPSLTESLVSVDVGCSDCLLNPYLIVYASEDRVFITHFSKG